MSIRRLAALALVLVGALGAVTWARSTPADPAAPVVGTDRVVVAIVPGTTPATTTPTRASGPTSTLSATTAAPVEWPDPLPPEWKDRLWITLPATPSSPERSAPVEVIGPGSEWSPDYGTVQVFRDERLVLPCEGGAVFALGHANFSTVADGWDFFYDVIDSERYEGDHGLDPGQHVVIGLDDGSELCRYEVYDLADGPGEHLAVGPGRYFPKTAFSGDPDDPTGGPDDQLIRRAWELGEPTLYLLGSYAGPTGDEMDATGRHQAHNFVVAARLIED